MKTNNEGFTLVELIVVLGIVAILIAIVTPRFINNIEKTKESVCNINCSELQKIYYEYLILKDVEHSEELLEEYIRKNPIKICPSNGSITYDEGIKCNIHSRDSKDEDSKEIPYI